MKSKPESSKLTKNLLVILVLVLILTSSCTTRSYYLHLPDPPLPPDTNIVSNISIDSLKKTSLEIANSEFPKQTKIPIINRLQVEKINIKKADFIKLANIHLPDPPPPPDTLRYSLLRFNHIKTIFIYKTDTGFKPNEQMLGKILDSNGKEIATTNSKNCSLDFFEIKDYSFAKVTFNVKIKASEKTKYLDIVLPVSYNGRFFLVSSVWKND